MRCSSLIRGYFMQMLPETSVSSIAETMSFREADVTFAPHSPQGMHDPSMFAPASREASPAPPSTADGNSMWDHHFAGTNSYAAAHALAIARSAVTPEEAGSMAFSASPHSSGKGDNTGFSSPWGGPAASPPPAAPPQQSTLPVAHAPVQQWPTEPQWTVQPPGVPAAAHMPRSADGGLHADACMDMRGAASVPTPDMSSRAIQDEVDRLRMEREHVSAIRANLQQAQQALDQERLAFEAHKVRLAAAECRYRWVY
jgi:hypothetical protein